ncbi:uncharacterized protein LOC134832443 [Culicoides brevitarsis]|uniref:uncharacterized protein LOC134832443 n=1 Tax=Culicoides brevitarsis TaxID=469753 RepID=UPI00307BC6C9
MINMKKFYSVKNNDTPSNTKAKTLSTSSNNLLDKISRRYSGISTKFLRKSPGRKGNRDAFSGSYNMRGNQSDDLRPEIGAPILISKIDRTDLDDLKREAAKSPSSLSTTDDSENDVYVDANCSLQSFSDIHFQFFPDNASSPNSSFDANSYNMFFNQTAPLPSFTHQEENAKIEKYKSKSAQNLHRSELKVFLKKAPSLEIIEDFEENTYDMPKKCLSSKMGEGEQSDSSTGVSEPPIVPLSEKLSYSIQTLELLPSSQTNTQEVNVINSTNKKQNLCHEESLQSNCSNNTHKTDDSCTTTTSYNDADFDFKSASLQSLNRKNMFLSIEELNEITRQINESEEFNQEIDYEYVEHRENLKPSERRITLLRNKETNRFINFNDKKDRIAKKWTGVKHWISEERGKIREVVHRHAAMQRPGAVNRADSVETNCTADDELSSLPASSDARTDKDSPNRSTNGRESEERQCDHSFPTSRKTSLNKSSLHNDSFEGQNGFEELRRYVKQGGDFGKDLAFILQERIEAEQNYAKSLSKMASKLNKACRDIPGTIADAWRSVSTEMESRSEVHRQFSVSLSDEIVKPLKTIIENQHKSRKAIETNVDKAVRVLVDWRNAESKGKKNSHASARENERLQDAMLDARIQKSPSISLLPHTGTKNPNDKDTPKEKECVKLESKRRKAEEAVKKADVEYYTLCVRAERARVDWEIAVFRGSSMLQSLESQRLGNMKEYAKLYHKLSCDMNPLMDKIVRRIEPQIINCNVQKDLTVLKNIRRAAEGPSEQLLPDFYSEHTTLAMNRERRKQSLVKLLQLIRQDLERERKSRNGLKGFSQTVNNADNQNITDKLYHIRSMLTYLEGARYKLQSALMELDHRPRGSHPLAQHIQITRDRNGLQQSILKVPIWLRNDENDNSNQSMTFEDFDQSCTEAALPMQENIVIECENETIVEKINAMNKPTKEISEKTEEDKCDESPTFDRGVADGNSNQPDSDFDEFSSDDESHSIDEKPPEIISKCRALYSYTPKLYDELELFQGDIIEVYAKQDDGWWMGGLRKRIGIFPATYVEEISQTQ